MASVSSTVALEPKKIKFVTVSIVSLSLCYEVIGPCHDLCFLNVVLSAGRQLCQGGEICVLCPVLRIAAGP